MVSQMAQTEIAYEIREHFIFCTLLLFERESFKTFQYIRDG